MGKPTLLILAAGMGSRYGGLKQLDGIGPNGETIMDYSVYDAIRVGFGKIVFVIRKDFEEDFRSVILSKYRNVIDTEVVFQQIDSLPCGYTPNPERIKPWGTNHAILMAKDAIHTPFAVINADDFYGHDSFSVLGKALIDMAGSKNTYCMVGFRVGNTLSEGGSVSRGVCSLTDSGFLNTVVEHHGIQRSGDGRICYADDDKISYLKDDTIVSMNMWGFTPDYFEYSEVVFGKFLEKYANDLYAEFYIPTMVNDLITTKTVTVKVLSSNSRWFGVTYVQDRENVRKNIEQLIQQGIYPNKLFQ